MSRLHELLHSIPPSTLGVIGLCSFLYLVQIASDLPLRRVTLCPRLVIFEGEVYRILTSALFHASLMHIGMNLGSVFAIGGMLEKRLGSLRMFCTMLLSILLTSVIYIMAALFLDVVLKKKGLMNQHSVGFSGVIFHLSVLECNLEPHASRSVFGIFVVPSFLYPWVLLVVLQIVMPNLSFAGHLSGIVTGTLQLYGMLNALIPSESCLLRMDEWNSIRRLTSMPSYVATTSIQNLPAGNAFSWIQRRSVLSGGLGFLASFLANALEICKVAVFGRGRLANSNIQLDRASDFQQQPLTMSTNEYDDWGDPPPASRESPRETISQII